MEQAVSRALYKNGPSGKIKTARRRDKHQIWGSVTPAGTKGRVSAIDQTWVYEVVGPNRSKNYKVCCLNIVNIPSQSGDSGALVAYAGTGNRHIAGLLVVGDRSSNARAYIPANDLRMAFKNAGKEFSHFWGTKSSYRTPSTQTCDPPGC